MSFDEMVDEQIREDIADLKRQAQEESVGDGADYERGFIDGMNSVDRPVDSSNWQIRIEALRAAATVSGAVIHEAMEQLGEPPNTTQAEDYTLRLAKRFERYLEDGE